MVGRARIHARPTVERLQEAFRLEAETGQIWWRFRPSNRARLDRPAGGKGSDGYLVVRLDGLLLQLHHVVWALTTGAWPAENTEIDHEDRDRANNRPGNLRELSHAGNMRNAVKTSATGFRGVTKTGSGRFAARTTIDRQTVHLGLFDTVEEAARAYDTAVLTYCGPRFPTNANLGLLK